jgi:hypothetical protein
MRFSVFPYYTLPFEERGETSENSEIAALSIKLLGFREVNCIGLP